MIINSFMVTKKLHEQISERLFTINCLEKKKSTKNH